MTSSNNIQPSSLPNGHKLMKLTVEQIEQIDELLVSLGDYGEVHLVIQHGQVRYINKVESHKAWNDEKVKKV